MAEPFAALDAARARAQITEALDEITARTKAAAAASAETVATGARSRVARRTGQTEAGIRVEESYDQQAYVVLVWREGGRPVPVFLEYGTRYMTKRPFLFAAAAVEEGAHADRVDDAVRGAIVAVSLGG